MVNTSSHRRTVIATTLSPDVIRRTAFDRTPLGRRGYPEADVDRFLDRIADEMATANAEKAELRAEIDRLRNYFQHQKVDPTKVDPTTPSVQAVNTLSLAQQAADQHLAQAENQARDLLATARRHYETIVEQAHLKAEEAVVAARQAQVTNDPSHDQTQQAALEARVTYLRTFADVTQVQVRSILEALRQELDRLAYLEVQRP
jgi:DivIVA domain-containing protein